MEPEIVSYIKEARKHGLDDAVIKQNLLNAGWEAGTVEESFVYEKSIQTPVAAPAFNPADLVHAQVSQPQPMRTTITAAPGITQTTQAGKKSHGRGIAVTVIVLLIILGDAAYAYFVYGYFNPNKVWQKFEQTPLNSVYQSTVKFSYADPNSLNSSSSIISLQKLKFDFNGDFYANASDPKNPESSTTAEYTYGDGGTSLSTTFQYTLLNNALYIDIGDNPLLSIFKTELTGGQNADWIKIDLSQLENSSSTPGSLSGQQLQNIFNTGFVSQLQQIWDNANVIKVGKFDGLQKINGVETMHFQNELDKQALKNAFGQILTTIVGAINKQDSGTISSQNISDTEFAVNAIIDKFQVSDMETWVGATDFKLYQVHFASNAPSIISAIQYFMDNSQQGGFGLGTSVSGSRDAKRITDVHELASAFELYYNDYDGYPDASNGTPVGMAPTYIGVYPTAPEPADGTCTDYYNGYWYTPSGTKSVSGDHSVHSGTTVYSSYTLTFCLGGQTESYAGGIAKLTPAGIQADVPCPSSDQSQCVNPNPQVATSTSDQDAISKIINGIQFNGTVTVDATYHDYGKVVPLTAPAGAYDVTQGIGSAQANSRDATRIADARELASAMELYFNDHSAYPDNLSQLVPNYIGVLPVAPSPADGTCTDAQNNYVYSKLSIATYKLTFCLGTNTGGYPAGLHTLSETGIE